MTQQSRASVFFKYYFLLFDRSTERSFRRNRCGIAKLVRAISAGMCAKKNQ